MLSLITDERPPLLVPLLKVNKKNGISKRIKPSIEGQQKKRNRGGKEGEDRPKLLILVEPQEIRK